MKEPGLIPKYIVARKSGRDVGACIVLEFNDPISRIGITAWAKAMRQAGYEAVYQDVIKQLRITRGCVKVKREVSGE